MSFLSHISVKLLSENHPTTPFLTYFMCFCLDAEVSSIWYKYLFPTSDHSTRAYFAAFKSCILLSRVRVNLTSDSTSLPNYSSWAFYFLFSIIYSLSKNVTSYQDTLYNPIAKSMIYLKIDQNRCKLDTVLLFPCIILF